MFKVANMYIKPMLIWCILLSHEQPYIYTVRTLTHIHKYTPYPLLQHLIQTYTHPTHTITYTLYVHQQHLHTQTTRVYGMCMVRTECRVYVYEMGVYVEKHFDVARVHGELCMRV